MTLSELLALDREGLAAAFHRGCAVPARRLANRRFRGVSLGLPRVVERATWKLFVKDVVDDGGALTGWNVRVEQPMATDAATLLQAPLRPQERQGRPFTFGPFDVIDDGSGAIIDYRCRPNPFPLSCTVDPLRAVGDGSVLLGVSELVLFGARAVRTPTWFALVDAGDVPAGFRHV